MRGLILVFVIVWAGLWAGPARSQHDPGFATPQDAIATYLRGVAERDFGTVLSATAIEQLYLRFDFGAYVDSLGVLTPAVPAPAVDRLLVEIDKATFAAGIAQQVKMLCYALLGRWDLTETRGIVMHPGDGAAIAGTLDLQRLGGLELLAVGTPEPDVLNGTAYQEDAAERARNFGADEVSERVALLAFEGQTYVLGFQLMRFAQSWTITAQWSPLGHMNPTGIPWPMTREAFAELLE